MREYRELAAPASLGLTGCDVDDGVVARAVQHVAGGAQTTIVIRTIHCYHLSSSLILTGYWGNDGSGGSCGFPEPLYFLLPTFHRPTMIRVYIIATIRVNRKAHYMATFLLRIY